MNKTWRFLFSAMMFAFFAGSAGVDQLIVQLDRAAQPQGGRERDRRGDDRQPNEQRERLARERPGQVEGSREARRQRHVFAAETADDDVRGPEALRAVTRPSRVLKYHGSAARPDDHHLRLRRHVHQRIGRRPERKFL